MDLGDEQQADAATCVFGNELLQTRTFNIAKKLDLKHSLH
jgi:hypothetical protein